MKMPEDLPQDIPQEFAWIYLLEDIVMKIESKKIHKFNRDFVDESFQRFKLEIIPSRITQYFTERLDAKIIQLIKDRN